MKVLKKDGSTEAFEPNKIAAAIAKSAERAGQTLSEDERLGVATMVQALLNHEHEVPVEKIHSTVIMVLKHQYPLVGEKYESYHHFRKTEVAKYEKLKAEARETLYAGNTENANYDSTLTSTKGSILRGFLTKELYEEQFMNPDEIHGTKKGFIYIHDKRDLIFNSFNCCLFDMATVLNGGFEMAGVKYKQPKTLLSALQVIGDITLVATAQQFGGFTIPEIDKTLLPYFKASYMKHFKEGWEFRVEDPQHYAKTKTLEELHQGIQSLEMKLNTVPCSRGDTAFVTVSFGDIPVQYDTEDRAIMAEICKAILHVRRTGQGSGSPVVFPKLVYLHRAEQYEGDPMMELLFKDAIQCSSECMYPDYLSLDNSSVGDAYNRSGKVVSPMGCRAFLSPYSGEDLNEYYVGRANIGAVSLNLPLIYQYNPSSFMTSLDRWLEVARNFLRKRFEVLAESKASINPLCYTQGGIHGGNKAPDEAIGIDMVRQFTASFGITSLDELCVLWCGCHLHEALPYQQDLILGVVKHIKERIEMFGQHDGYLYALYGTPAESLCGTQNEQFKKMFNNHPITEDGFFTNSFHMHVGAEITPIEKQDLERPFFHEFTGGRIQYVRIHNRTNLEAIHDIVKRGMEMGFYQGVNFELVVCDECGHRPNQAVEKCPKCGSEELTITDRVCGYLGYRKVKGRTRFNDAKMAEVKKRKSM